MSKDNKGKEDIFRQSICRKEKEMIDWIEYIHIQEEDFLLDVMDLKSSGRIIHGQKIA